MPDCVQPADFIIWSIGIFKLLAADVEAALVLCVLDLSVSIHAALCKVALAHRDKVLREIASCCLKQDINKLLLFLRLLVLSKYSFKQVTTQRLLSEGKTTKVSYGCLLLVLDVFTIFFILILLM